MPKQFKYRAVTGSGERRTGVITAGDRSQALDHLAELHLVPVSLDEVRQRPSLRHLQFRRKESERLIQFTSSLATMYRAGIPLLQALSHIRIGGPGSRFNRVIDNLRNALQSGRSLSDALREHPWLFSDVYVSCVAAGEESGTLDNTLDELAAMLETELELQRQVKSAVRYPIIVVTIIMVAVMVLTGYVIPRFVDFYDAFGAKLPWATRYLIAVSGFMNRYWALLILAVGGLVAGFRYWVRTPKGKEKFDRAILHLPVIGDLIVESNVARFAMMFRLMFSAGIPIVRSLRVLAGTVKNTIIAREVARLEDLFRRGKGLEEFENQTEWFPRPAVHMLAIGLETGNLDRMLRELGQHYVRHVSYTAKALTSLLEPLLTLVLGGLVLVLALAIFLPMWSLIQVFRG